MHIRDRLRGRMFLFAVFSLMLTSCGRSAHELETAPVSGRVTLDGRALASGYVLVVPSKGRMAKGAIRPDGTFVLGTYENSDGAQVGAHPVIVTPVPRDEGAAPRNAVDIPQKYSRAQTSALTIDVQAGKHNEVELTLLSEVENQ